MLMAKNKTTQEPLPSKAEKNLNIASTIILAIIVVTFIAAPTVTGILGSGAVSFGSYAGRPIEHTGDNFFGNQVRQMAQFQSNQLPPETLWRQAFQNAAFRVAIQVEAEEAGVLISSPLVDNELRQFGPYLDQDGQFSPQIFRETPDADKARYRQDVEQSLLQNEWIQTRITGPKLPNQILRDALALSYPQRKFDYVSFSEEDYPLSEVERWGKENERLFRTMVLSRITITTSDKDAEFVRSEILKGERTFESLAEAYSKDQYAQMGGSIGKIAYHELLNDFAQESDLESLFNLRSGELSQIYQTPVGWSVYRVQEGAKSAQLNDPQTLQAIRQYMNLNERGLIEDYLNKIAQEFTQIVQNRGWEAALRQFNKSTKETGFIALNFGNNPLLPNFSPGPDGELGGLNSSESFFRQTFKLNPNQASIPISSNRRVFVFRLKEIKQAPGPNDRPLDAMVQQAQFSISNQRVQQYQNLLLSSYKFKDNFEEGYRQRLRTFQE